MTVDSHLRFDGNMLGLDLVEEIFDRTEIPNPEREAARIQNYWGWKDIPKVFQTAWLEGDTVVIERGFALQLKWLLRSKDIKVVWDDKRKFREGGEFIWMREFEPRPHQPEAARAMRKHQQGFYMAPTGSGKSLSALLFIHKVHPEKTIVLVDKVELLNQWIKEFNTWFAHPIIADSWRRWIKARRPLFIGQIGQGIWIDEPRIVVATVQSLWKALKSHKIHDEFFGRFDCVIHDEAHHVPANTLTAITSRFPAKYRIGLSATPDKEDGRFQVALDVMGEVFHSDHEEKLEKEGLIVKPRVEVIKTEFEFDYYSAHTSDERGRCRLSGCYIPYRHSHKNNYHKLRQALVSDDARNSLVASIVAEQVETGNHHHLIISDEIRHLEAIRDKMPEFYDMEVFFVVGTSVQGKKRSQVIDQILAADNALIYSTVAKEGLDIPKIDRVYLPFPSSNAKTTKQKVGRATRSANGKVDAVVFDFLDIKVGKLKEQFKKRRVGFYNKAGIEVNIP